MSFETIFIGPTLGQNVTQSPSGKPLTDFCGFMYYITGPGGDGQTVIANNTQYQNGGSGYMNSGYIDFEHPYNVNLSTINVKVVSNVTEISFEYTNDPSITQYPINSGPGFPVNSDIPITPGTVRIVADQPTNIINNTDNTYNSQNADLYNYLNSQGFYNGGVYTPIGASEPFNFNTMYNQRWISPNITPTTYTIDSEGSVTNINSTNSFLNGGGYYGGVNLNPGVTGPFGRSSGGVATDVTNPPGTYGYAVLTLIPNEAITYQSFTGSTLQPSGDINAWDSAQGSTGGIGVTGLYLYGMAGGGGAGGFLTNAQDNGGGGGGGGGILSFGFTEIPNGATGYYCDIVAGAGGPHTSVSSSTWGDNGNSSFITFYDQLSNVYEKIECLPGLGGKTSSTSTITPTSTDGGAGYYGGGGGNYSTDSSLNTPAYAFGGLSLIRIPSYQGFNTNPTDYVPGNDSRMGGNGGGSINPLSFGRCLFWGTDPGDDTFVGGGGGGLWGGCGVSQDTDPADSLDNGITSAYGYASGGGGGGSWSSATYAGGAGSGGYVILKKITSNNCYLITLNSSSGNTTIKLSEFINYTGVWCYTEGINTVQNSNVTMVSNSLYHFLIKEDGLTSIQYTASSSSLVFEFKKLNLNGTLYNQNVNFATPDLTQINYFPFFMFSNTFRYKLFFYR